MDPIGYPNLGQTPSGPASQQIIQMKTILTAYITRAVLRWNESFPRDGSERFEAPLPLKTYTTGTVPTASEYAGSLIYVSDGSAGQKFRGSDGTSWVNLG